MTRIGESPMPDAFPYRDVFQAGRPLHQKTDPFRIRHPSMDPGRRAKIFAPFDALRGFRFAIRSQEVIKEAAPQPEAEDPAYEERGCEKSSSNKRGHLV